MEGGLIPTKLHLGAMTTLRPHFDQIQAQYRARLAAESVIEHYIERRFTSAKESGGFPPDIARAYSSLLRAREPVLAELLNLPNVIALAEPGAGKSTVARAAMTSLFARADILPVRVALLECNATRTVETLIVSALRGVDLEPGQRFHYVLDGLDEIPREFLERTSGEISALFMDERTAGVFVTSRQAFYVSNRGTLPDFNSVFHLLDFSNEDIHAYVRSRGVDRDVFIAETRRLAFFDEIRNPFNLKHAVDMYQKSGRLPATRSELLEFIVRSQLQTRPEISGFRQQRALEQLAVAMEVYARNELSEEEAIHVIRQSIHGISEAESRQLLDTLYTTILKRVEGGLAFQLASYGEYLAGQSLAYEPLERLKQIAFDQGGVPNYSWSNTVSYLAELNAKVREYFCRWHPLWMMNVSPAALSGPQRDDVVAATLRLLKSERMLLVDHPRVQGHRLARLVTASMKPILLGLLQSEDEVEKGNALSLLGMIGGVTEVVDPALALLTNRQNSILLRRAAILALLDTHSDETAPRLLQSLEADDPLHLNIVDVIGTAATVEQLPQVLPLLLQTSGMPSSAYYRFQELRSRNAVVTMLRYAIDHVNQVNTMRAKMYFESVLNTVAEHFDEQIASLCAELLSLIELQHINLDHSGPLYKLFGALQHLEDAQKERLLQEFFERIRGRIAHDGATFFFTRGVFAVLMTIGSARWLVEHHETDLITSMAVWVEGDVRTYLAPHSAGVVAAQDAAREQYRQEEQARQADARDRIEDLQASLCTRSDLNEAIDDFAALTKEHWPPLNATYTEWLTEQLSARLTALNLTTRIVWEGNSVTFPSELNLLLDVIAFYDLTLADARPLVWALILGCNDAVVRYFRKHPMFAETWEALFDLLGHPPAPPAREHVVEFIARLQEFPGRIREELTRLAESPTDHGHVQADACALVAGGNSDAWLLERVAHGTTLGVRNAAETELIRRQHEPTIMAKLDAAIRNPADLGTDNYFPPTDASEWLSKVIAPFAWTKLVVLRERGLQLELHGVVVQCTEQLLKIDRAEAIAVLKHQVKSAPASWRIRQRAIILEQEQQLAIETARSSPFESVLSKLKFNTSSTRVKVWCEGINDEEVFRTLIERMADTPIDVAVENVHGWPGLQQEQDPNVWLAQCNEAVIIMDGDNGRQLKKKDRPWTKLARTQQAKLRGFPITFIVLEKYGIENYFTQAAIEAVIGQDLSRFFPIPDDVPIRTHLASAKQTISWKIRNAVAKLFKLEAPPLPSFYPKGKNREVARYLQPDDLKGTDFYDALTTIVNIAKRLQGEP